MRACDRSRTINSRLVVGATKGCQEAGEPCPCKTGRGFSRVRAACVARARGSRPRLSSARGAESSRRLALPGNRLDASWAGSQGGQGQEFLGVRECLAHIAVHHLQPGNPARGSLEAVRRDSQGRCRSSKRIFLRSGVSPWLVILLVILSVSVCWYRFSSCSALDRIVAHASEAQFEKSVLSC